MFAEIVLQRRVPGKLDRFTYNIPKTLSIAPGNRVLVPFRKQRLSGVVVKLRREQPKYPTRDVLGILDEPHLPLWQVNLAEWMADYYLSPVSKIIPLFFPTHVWKGKKLRESRTQALGERSSVAIAKKLPPLTQNERVGKKTLLWGSNRIPFYLHFIAKTIKEKKTVLLILPELHFTKSFLHLFEKYFPGKFALLHSRMKETERTREWYRILRGEASIVLGSKLALFAPLKKLGLLILESEEDPLYKQEKTPYYHAREVAGKLATLTGAKLVFGTDAPSLETYVQSKRERWNILRLPKKKSQLTVVNLRDEQRKGNYSFLTDTLREKLAKNLAQKKTSLLFLNRRGVATALWCRDCHYLFRCPTCEIPLVSHRTEKMRKENGYLLMCHHCGWTNITPASCPVCHGVNLKFLGAGTEKMEEEVKAAFSLAKVLRFDRDTLSDPKEAEEMEGALQKGAFDMVIGTQAILNIPDITFPLVAVVLFDTFLHIPDFRTTEHAYQRLAKLRERASEEFLIQTFHPDHPLLHEEDFYTTELKARKTLNYPPYAAIVRLTYRHAREETCLLEIKRMLSKLQEKNREELTIHAAPPLIAKRGGKFRFHIFIRGKRAEEFVKPFLPLPAGWILDRDPVSLL